LPISIIGASEATPGTGTVNIAFPLDRLYSRLDANDSIRVGQDLQYLLGVFYTAESTGGRVLVRQPARTDKAFLKCCLTTDNDPTQGYTHLFNRPIPLDVGSKLEVLSVNATDEDTLVGLIMGTGFVAPKPDMITDVIDGYSDTTITANAWSTCGITWNQSLKQGVYSIVGMKASSYLAANHWGGLTRLVVPGNPSIGCGVLTGLAAADHEQYESVTFEPYSYWGDLGMTFEAPNQMPNIECLSPSAWTDENVQLMLKRVR